MALSDIIAKIERDAETEAEAIRNAARVEAEVLLTRAQKEVNALAAKGKEDAERTASKTRGRIVARAMHEAKFALQMIHVSLIERVFSETEQKFLTLPAKEYIPFVSERARLIQKTHGTLTVAAEREEETRAALKGSDIPLRGGLAAKAGDLLGGFVFETDAAIFDHSFRTLLSRARERYTIEIARELFTS